MPRSARSVTTYSYFLNDNVQTITDARGATTTLSYNNRGLATGITYGVLGGVAATPNVGFGYDAAGNRTSMTDGLGTVTYNYNTISQLTSETRSFTGVGSYSLSYGYNLSGELNSITNPWSAQVGYSYDKIGRPSSVSGSGYAAVSSYVSSMAYRAFGLKGMSYSNGRTLSVQYDNRMRPTQWNIPGVMGWNYSYSYFGENTGRVTYAQNINDSTLDRSYDYDQLGRLIVSRSGGQARYHLGITSTEVTDGPYGQSYLYDQWGNMTTRAGWGGDNPAFSNITYTNNKRAGLTYDAAGNLTNDGGQTFTYDATGQSVGATYGNLQQSYDGDRLRVKKVDNGTTTYYLRSSVLGGQVVAELNSGGTWQRGYVYLGGQMLAVQQSSSVSWVHQDPLVKSKRVTNSAGTVVSTVELDPWGAVTGGSSNDAFQPHKFNTYERDANASDEAMFRRYNYYWTSFHQPDPYDGSYQLTNPQSFNRYAFVQDDPVNFVDPMGLDPDIIVTNIWGRQLSDFSGSFGGAGTGITIDNPSTGEGGEIDGGTEPQEPTQQQQQSCDPYFFGESDSFNIGGRAFTGGDLNIAARVVYAESSSGFSRFNNNPVGSQVFDERNAIASVLCNLLSPTLTTFNAIAHSGRFNSVTTPGETGKFDGSAPGSYQNLSERTADDRGGDCNDLRSSVDAIRRMVNNNGPYYNFNRFRGGVTPVGNSTVIGGSRFGYGGITNTGLGPW